MKKLFVVVVFAFAGCAGTNTQSVPVSTAVLASNVAPMSAPAHSKSAARRIYISDSLHNSLTFYSYKTGKEEGSITSGLSNPEGLCSDSKGNVFLANTDDFDVLEFPNGGTTPNKTITTTGEYPGGCAISSKGDLAVVAICTSPSCGAGELLLYPHETGSGIAVNCPNTYHYFYITYDGKGNLFAEGDDLTGTFEFCEVPKGTTKAIAITLDSPPPFPAPVHWDGKYIVTTYASGDVIARYTITGTNGTLENTVTLSGAEEYFTMASKKAVVAETATGFGYWKYPSGGNPRKTEQLTNDEFGGMTVSPAPIL